MEVHHRNGENPSAELLALSATNQEHLNSNVGNPNQLGASIIKEMDPWLRGWRGRRTRNSGNESKALGFSKFWGVSQYKGRGCYLSFYLESYARESLKSVREKTVYIGIFTEELDAARAHDLAKIALTGTTFRTNFPVSEYKEDLKILRLMNLNDRLEYIRRKLKCISDGNETGFRGVSMPPQYNNRWKARIGSEAAPNIHRGTFEDAARAYDVAANLLQEPESHTNFQKENYDEIGIREILRSKIGSFNVNARNAMPMPSQLVQNVASPVSNLNAAIENKGNVELPWYHELDQLGHKRKERHGLLSFHQLQNPSYFGGPQNITSLQGYQFPKIYDDSSTGFNEPLGFNVGLEGTTRSGHDQGNGTPPLNFPSDKSPSTMETLETQPLLLGAVFKIGSTSKHLGDYHQSQAFSPRRFSSNAEEPVRNAKPVMPYQFDNQFETNASELVVDSFFQVVREPAVALDSNLTYNLDNLVEPEPSEFVSSSVFQKTFPIMNLDEVLATMEADKCFDGAASVGNCIETNEGSTQKDAAAASTAANEDMIFDYSTLMNDTEFSKWLEYEKILL